jgi:hypothetical protein
MTKKLFKTYLVMLLAGLSIFGTSLLVSAQSEAANNTASKAGEVISYNLYYKWKLIWMKGGNAQMSTRSASWHGTPAYRMDLSCRTNSTADVVFKMRDTITSIVATNLIPLYYRKGSFEDGTYTLDQAWFTYSNKKCHIKQRRVRKGQVTNTAFNSNRNIYDMLSIIAYARSFNMSTFKVGQKIYLPVATGKRVESQTLTYGGISKVEADNDLKYRCHVFTLWQKRDNKMKEVVTFYVTDDANKLPIRLDMYLKIGVAKVLLRSFKGVANPVTSQVK